MGIWVMICWHAATQASISTPRVCPTSQPNCLRAYRPTGARAEAIVSPSRSREESDIVAAVVLPSRGSPGSHRAKSGRWGALGLIGDEDRINLNLEKIVTDQ